MRMQRALGLVVVLLLAPALAAAALKAGDVIVLKTSGNQYLSAVPGEGLALSPNTAAWEQWLVRDTPPYLVSFHGTGLVIKTPPGRHVPTHSGDGGFHARLFGLVPGTSNGVPVLKLGGAASDGGEVMIATSSTGSALSAWGGKLDSGWCGGTDYKPCAWRVSIVANPAPRPSAVLEAARSERTTLFSTHGTWMLYTDPSPLPSRSLHLANRPGYISAIYFPALTNADGADTPLLYGQSVRIRAKFPHPTMNPAPMVSLDYNLRFAVENASTVDRMWTLSDPSGANPAGTRIPLGAKLCVHSSNSVPLRLQADPRTPEVRFSPNCDAWEQWTIRNIE